MTEAVVHETAAPVRLRQAREAAGLHVAVLASALKVPVHKLEALEEGRYDLLPDLVFARALASSACRHLKIDPGPVLDEIPSPGASTLGEVPRAISAPFRASKVDLGSSAGTGTGGLKVAGWIAGVLVVAAAVVMLLPEDLSWLGWSGKTGAATQAVTPAGEGAVVEPVLQTLPVLPAATGEASQTPDSGVTTPEPDQAPASPELPAAVQAGEAGAAAQTGAPAAAEGSGLLVLTARGDSWVEVTNGSRAVVVQRMMKAGDRLEFSSAPPYSVILGRADQVDVTVRGKPYDVLPLARNSVARFEVK